MGHPRTSGWSSASHSVVTREEKGIMHCGQVGVVNVKMPCVPVSVHIPVLQQLVAKNSMLHNLPEAVVHGQMITCVHGQMVPMHTWSDD